MSEFPDRRRAGLSPPRLRAGSCRPVPWYTRGRGSTRCGRQFDHKSARGKRRLVLDIVYTKPNGSPGRLRRDADIQMLAAPRAEERQRRFPSPRDAQRRVRAPKRRAPVGAPWRCQRSRPRAAGSSAFGWWRGGSASGVDRPAPCSSRFSRSYRSLCITRARSSVG